MNELEKIIKKDPLHIADDDHPDRKDITEEEFSKAVDQMTEKYNQRGPASQKDIDFADEMAQATLDALNGKGRKKKRNSH